MSTSAAESHTWSYLRAVLSLLKNLAPEAGWSHRTPSIPGDKTMSFSNIHMANSTSVGEPGSTAPGVTDSLVSAIQSAVGLQYFTDAMEARVRALVTLGTELREAIASSQLFLVYQPQVDVDTRQISGVKALVRWRHPMPDA